MAHHDHEWRIVGDQANGAQEILYTVGLFFIGETLSWIFDGGRFVALCIDRHEGIHRQVDTVTLVPDPAAKTAWNQGLCNKREQR